MSAEPLVRPDDSAPLPPGACPVNSLDCDEKYKERMTGLPRGIEYRVEEPETGLVYFFDAFMEGHLIYTVHDFAHHFDPDLANVAREDVFKAAYVDAARLQLIVAQGFPISWLVQEASDVQKIQLALMQAGFDSITVVHMP